MRVGIITMLYSSRNYGGVLQAYALTKIINKYHFDAKQIMYRKTPYTWKSKIYYIFSYIMKRPSKKDSRDTLFEKRGKSFDAFIDQYIPHTKKIYTNQSIKHANRDFDAFITGSDQVWCSANPAFYLQFVKKGKHVISYAASISREKLSEEQTNKIPKYLKRFEKISVREEKAHDQLKGLGIESEIVLDPTLLLDVEEWKSLSSERIIDEKYLFCYFLGDNTKHREIATRYAKTRGLKIVTLPNMQGITRECDNNFGEVPLYEINPCDFISLINYAEFVLTDSFHATAFSIMLQKQFLVFDRKISGQSMSSRLYTLASYFGLGNRIMTSNKHIQDTIPPIEYKNEYELFEKSKEQSINFLLSALSSNQ